MVFFLFKKYYKNLDLCFCQSAQCIVQELTPKDFGAFSHHHEEKLTYVVQTFNSECVCNMHCAHKHDFSCEVSTMGILLIRDMVVDLG